MDVSSLALFDIAAHARSKPFCSLSETFVNSIDRPTNDT